MPPYKAKRLPGKAKKKPSRAAAAAETNEPGVRADDPMPDGYKFVPKGNVYITKNCRKKTHDAGKRLYVVLDKRDRTIGLRCPTHIYHDVMSDNNATATQRAEAVQKRDAAIHDNFEDAVVKLFPKIPKAEVPQILKQSLKKHSRRVGRAGAVALDDRVKLAVRAHIRHMHTDYDQLLEQGASREAAREKVWERLNEVARQWGGQPLKPGTAAAPARERYRKKSKATASSSRKNTKAGGAAKKATVLTPRATTRRMSREASELLPSVVSTAHSPNPGCTGLHVRTRRMTAELVLSEKDDVLMMDELDVDVSSSPEGTDVQNAILISDDDTSDSCDESDGSDWGI
jgi:hypothetical protein